MPDIKPILDLLESSRPVDQKAGTERLRELAKDYARHIRPLYHVIPWSDHIVSEEAFRRIYSKTLQLTDNLTRPSVELLAKTIRQFPASLMVFRLISGYQWEELADIVEVIRAVKVSKGQIQKFEQGGGSLSTATVAAIAEALFDVIAGREMRLPASLDPARYRTRSSKIDTKDGWSSVTQAVRGPLDLGHLLYERYTGRPFAYVRDALSEAKGNILEDAVSELFRSARIPFEAIHDNRLEGFTQAPDFVLPNRQHPTVVIEAKLTEDGGTARDKASRIERIYHGIGSRRIALVAVIDEKGFRRINDVLAPILRHTRGRTFFSGNLSEILAVSEIARRKPR
ncbi:MAG: hypothetical protein ACREA0_01885 [bacterium]